MSRPARKDYRIPHGDLGSSLLDSLEPGDGVSYVSELPAPWAAGDRAPDGWRPASGRSGRQVRAVFEAPEGPGPAPIETEPRKTARNGTDNLCR